LRSALCCLPLLHFLGGLPLLAEQFGDQRDHAGVDAGHQPVGFLAFVVPAKHPAGAAGQIGHVRAPVVQEKLEADAQPVPALLERHDAGIAARDFERYGGAGFL
jgi:hypothetical protein